MREYVRVCCTDEISEGEPRCFELPDGNRIAVFRLGDDFYATSDKCTHGNASLSDGWQEKDVIECPFHGGSFNIKTGKAVNFPCIEPVRTYDVKLKGDALLIAV